MCDQKGWGDVPLWYAHYDNNPSFSDFTPFADWTKPVAYVLDQLSMHLLLLDAPAFVASNIIYHTTSFSSFFSFILTFNIFVQYFISIYFLFSQKTIRRRRVPMRRGRGSELCVICVDGF